MTKGVDPASLGLQIQKQRPDGDYLVFCPFSKHNGAKANYSPKKALLYCYVCKRVAKAEELAMLLGGMIVWKNLVNNDEYTENDWKRYSLLPNATDSQYLSRRGLFPETLDEYQIKENSAGVYFPLYNNKNKLIGYQHRKSAKSEYRYIVYGTKPPLYPYDRFEDLKDNDVPILVEGVISALKGRQFEKPVFSTIGSNINKEAISILKKFKKILVVYDDDLAGYIGATKILLHLPQARIVVPGLEADEIGFKTWENIYELKNTRSLTEIKSYVNIENITEYEGSIQSILNRRNHEKRLL